MQPVVLTTIEGKNFVLGTFDTTNFQDWWKSEPFPGSVESIEMIVHAYGQYHVCICKMVDGSYAIYRTKNMGKSWESVYTTSDVIYTITTIDYGWLIASTSTGWIESKTDSGRTWSVISSFAPGCKSVININDDILFAHDGRKVWKSVDLGKTWSIVLDSSSWYSEAYYGYIAKTTSWNSDCYPALAGVGQYVFVGFGPYLIISDDLGNNWHTHWAQYYSTGQYNSWYGLVPPFGPRYNSRILQLVVTETDINPINCSVMARILMNNTSTVEYWYCGPQTQVPSAHSEYKGYQSLGSNWIFKSSYPYKGEMIGDINSCEVLQPGSPEKDLLCSLSTFDSNNSPIVMYSSDAGYTWNPINSSNVTVYEGDPTQEISSVVGQQTFDEEYFVKSTWVGLACHNKGSYIIDYNHTVRGISLDQDLLAISKKTKGLSIDYTTLILKTKTYEFDLLNKKYKYKSCSPDLIIKDTVLKSYLHGIMVSDVLECSHDMYCGLASRLLISYDVGILNKNVIDKNIFYDILLFDTPEKTYGMEIKMIGDHVEQIMNSIERYSPQSPDIRYPDIPYVPYDSRTQNVTP